MFQRKFAWRLPDIQSYRIAEAIVRWAREALDKEPGTWTLPVFHLRYHDELLRAADDEETRRILLHSLREAASDETSLSNLLNQKWLGSQDTLLPNLRIACREVCDIPSCSVRQRATFCVVRRRVGRVDETASGVRRRVPKSG